LKNGKHAFIRGSFAIRGNTLLHWTPRGYGMRKRRPRGLAVDVLTPPAVLAALSAGYGPRWHPSAESAGYVTVHSIGRGPRVT
jgi:hypothetical protein